MAWFLLAIRSLFGIVLCALVVLGIMGHVAWISSLILTSSLSIFISYPLVVSVCYLAFEATMWLLMHLLNRLL